MANPPDIMPLRATEPLDLSRFGARAWRLSFMSSQGANLPKGLALSVHLIEKISKYGIDPVREDLISAFKLFEDTDRLVVRGSPQDQAWG